MSVLNKVWIKVVVPTVLVLVIVTGITTYLNTSRQTTALKTQLSEKGDDAATIVKNAIISPLTKGDNEAVEEVFKKVENELPDMNIYVCDADGYVSFSSEKGVAGKKVSSLVAQNTYAKLSSLLSSGVYTKGRVQERVNGKPYITVMAPFMNGRSCYHCHGTSKKVLGAIVVQIPAASAMAAVDAAKRSNILIGLVNILLIGLLIFVLTMVFVSKPMHHILEVLQAFAKGDLSKRITVKSGDEVGQMADALREMLNGVIGEGKSIKEGLTIPFFMVNKEMIVTFATPGTKAKIGVPARDTLLPEVVEMIEECMRTGQPLEGEVAIGKKRKVYLMVSTSPLRDLDGNIIGVMSIGMDITSQKESERMAEEHNRFLSEVAEEVTDVANQVASASEELSAVMKEMAEGAERQSQQSSQIAAAVEEMSATIMEMANNARDASQVADDTKKKAAEGSEVVHQSIESINKTAEVSARVANSIKELSERSREIGKVIDVISEIASQTNLLALNATIEAASAGEAGKGFAVVASEVKELAKQTAESTGNVQKAIENIHQGVEQAVKSMDEASAEVGKATTFANEAGAALMEILDRIDKAVEAIAQIATATEQLSAAANNVSENVMAITQVSSEAATHAQESANASMRLAELAERLLSTVKKFETK